MSRGFVKEDDQEEIPIVPPRADLPEGVTNYVTQIGMDELLEEKQSLIDEKENLEADSGLCASVWMAGISESFVCCHECRCPAADPYFYR